MKKIAPLMIAGICLLPLMPPAAASATRWGWSQLQHFRSTYQRDAHPLPFLPVTKLAGPVAPSGPERPAFIRVLEDGFGNPRKITYAPWVAG